MEGDKLKEYTVKQISDMLNTNPETVRRWIRSGKLAATQNSKKSGNIISSDSLRSFLQSAPKYAGMVAAGSAAALGVGATFPLAMSLGLITGNILSMLSHSAKQITPNAVKQHIENQIKKSEEVITQKEKLIIQLQQELNEERAKVDIMQQLLRSKEYEKIAAEINERKFNTPKEEQ